MRRIVVVVVSLVVFGRLLHAEEKKSDDIIARLQSQRLNDVKAVRPMVSFARVAATTAQAPGAADCEEQLKKAEALIAALNQQVAALKAENAACNKALEECISTQHH